MTILEICVEGYSGALAAAEGGADRVELCNRLDLGGTTPDITDLRRVLQLGLPGGVAAMIRPRAGDFTYTADEVNLMCEQAGQVVELVEQLGVDSSLVQLVTGALNVDSTLDLETLARVRDASRGLAMVCHRAFDETPDLFVALTELEELGFSRVLTSGGPGSVARPRVQKKLGEATSGLQILVCGGIRPHNLAEIVCESRAEQVHLRAPYPDGRAGTSSEVVAQARAVLAQLNCC